MIKRNNILKCLGKFPKRCNLDVKIIKVTEKQDYVIEEISYNVESNERVKALLLVPKNCANSMPGIIALHQHAGEYSLGKSEVAGINGDKNYAYGLELCLKGYVVLCPDNLCFEDRQDKELKGMEYERFVFTESIMTGSTLQAKYISDISCALRVLRADKKVDNDNIGVIGHSLGGQEALWTMWYLKNIKVGVSSCDFSKMKAILDAKINHNFSMYLRSFLEYGDIDDIVSSIAPKPFLMIAGIKDPLFPIKGVKEIEKKARSAYSKLKSLDNFKTLYFNDEHMFSKEMRQKAYSWLDLHLKK